MEELAIPQKTLKRRLFLSSGRSGHEVRLAQYHADSGDRQKEPKRKEAVGILYWGSSAAWAEGGTMAWSAGVAIARGIPCDRLLVLPFGECSRSCEATMTERG